MFNNYFELVNTDCYSYLKKIPDKSIDLALIDPPYEISKNTNFQKGEKTGRNVDRFRISMDFGNWDKNFDYLDKIIIEIFRVLKDGATCICFYDLWKITILKNYFEQAGFKQIRFIEWLKTNPVPINSKTNYLTNAREIAISGIKNKKPTFNSEYDNGIYEETGELYKFPICHDKGRFHPTQKPEDLVTALIKKHSKENDIILDCFSGSGTTAVCALKTGRFFKGCEINKDYYEKSINRIKNEIKCRF